MKTRQWSEERIIGLLQQAEKGETTIAELCRAQGISENSFYKWRQKYGGLQVNEARRLRELEQENSRLKKLVAETGAPWAGLDNAILKEVLGKK